jgi:hypothetical protein
MKLGTTRPKCFRIFGEKRELLIRPPKDSSLCSVSFFFRAIQYGIFLSSSRIRTYESIMYMFARIQVQFVKLMFHVHELTRSVVFQNSLICQEMDLKYPCIDCHREVRAKHEIELYREDWKRNIAKLSINLMMISLSQTHSLGRQNLDK